MSQQNSCMLKMMHAELFADDDVGGLLQPQSQSDWDMEKMLQELIAGDVGGQQPLQPQPQPMLQSDNQPPHSWEAMKMTEQFFADTCGYQPPQSQPQLQPLHQPQPMLQSDMKDIENNLLALDNQPPHSWDHNKQFETVIDEYLPEAMKMTEQYYFAGISGSQPPHQYQPQPRFFGDTCGYQPPQSQPQQQSLPHQYQPQFFGDTCGYQPPQSQPQPQFFGDTSGYQPPQSQPQQQSLPQPQVWTWEENKAFESFVGNCFQDVIQNRWEMVAARLPGKTPAQLQEHFYKLMNDINAIQNGYTTNTPLNAASQNMPIMITVPATTLEHNPFSIPITNVIPPPPPPPPPSWTDHQYHSVGFAP